MEEADQKERERLRLSSDSRTEGPKQGMASCPPMAIQTRVFSLQGGQC